MIVILTWPLGYIKERFTAICSGHYPIVRRCPVCGRHDGKQTIVGHGQRRRACFSPSSSSIIVRRGRCKRCKRTFTFLPCFVRPFHQYSVDAQAEALREYMGSSKPGLARAAPFVQDPERCAAGSTVRRWFTSLGNEGLLRKVRALQGRISHDKGSREGIAGSALCGSAGRAWKVFLDIWACLKSAVTASNTAVLGALPLSEASCFTFLLLLWYQGQGCAVT